MKLTFLFIVLILGIWLATTAFGRMFEGMEPEPKGKASPSMDEVLEQAKTAIEKVNAKETGAAAATKKATNGKKM